MKRENKVILTCGSKKAFSLNSILIVFFTFVALTFEIILPDQSSALTFIGFNGSAYRNGCDYKSYYMAMTSPDIDNVRFVSFSHRVFNPSNVRAAIYDDTGTLLFDSEQQNHTGVYEGDPLWQTFPINPPIDFDKNTSFGYAIKFASNGDCGQYTYGDNQGWPGGGSKGDCDQAYELPDEPSDTTIPFSPSVGSMNTINRTIYYLLSYVLYPTISSVTPGYLNDGQTDILINGAGFEEKDEFGAGTSMIWLTENNNWAAPGTKVQQTDVIWNTDSISINASFGALTPETTAYLWVENSDGQVNEPGYPMMLNTPCPSPPLEVGGSLAVTPDDGIYIPATFTISGNFVDPDNTVYGCLYTLDDGALWRQGTVSGTGPYTCTVSDVTATDGTLVSIRMKATSCGGTSTANSLLTRTIDAQGPVSTSFTATPGDTQCLLEWSGTDSGTGMHVTEPYEIKWATYNFPNCSYGSQLFIGTGTSINHSGLENDRTYYYRLCLKDNYSNTAEDAVSCTLTATPWNILNDGALSGYEYATGLSSNKSVSTFTLELTNGAVTDPDTVTDTVTDMVVTGTNTANVSSVKIYRDNGTVANKYDSGDTLITTSAFSGDTAVFSGLNILVTDTPTQYVITYDMVASPIEGQTLTGYVSSVTAQSYSVDNNDDVDAIMKIDTTLPNTTDNVYSSQWQGTEKNVVLAVTDSGGSGVDTTTGIYGCFGVECTPTVLGGIFMTTNCGAGNTCELPIRYYSVDRAGNIEPVKTDNFLARIDREAPEEGNFYAIGGATPINLRFDDFIDSGVGIDGYMLSRVDGPTPPADCSNGTYLWTSTYLLFDDYDVISGQQYSYRICARDDFGNTASGSVATATAGEPCTASINGCEACHGPNVSFMGGSRFEPPRGHAMHGPQCGACHRDMVQPNHVDGIITMNPMSGYQGDDFTWQSGGGGMSCGGTWSPVGGDLGGGSMGCHASGTPNYPAITPEWECVWEEFSICNPPQGP